MRAVVNPIMDATFVKLEHWDEFFLSDNIYLEAATTHTYASRNPRSKSRSKDYYYYYYYYYYIRGQRGRPGRY